MFLSKNSYFLLTILFLNLLLLSSCDKKEDVEAEPNYPKRMNYFSMEINGELWQPSFIDDDTCKQTFKGSQSSLSSGSMYNINAYKDPNAINDVGAENMLRLQIKDVVRTGEYEIKNDYRVHFKSFVSFQIRKDKDGNNKKTIYSVDSTKNIFSFYVDELVDTNMLGANQGIIGRFEGTLYNIENPLDSLIISNGKYQFKRTNWNDNCHCEK